MENQHHPTQNHLLATLLAEDKARIFPNLELVHLPLGENVYAPDSEIRYVWFPTTAIVSLLHVTENGQTAEIAVVGNEGLWVFHCLWAAKPHPVGQSCKVMDMPIV